MSQPEAEKANVGQPDWNRIAQKFDLWLPHIAPVGETLIERLDLHPRDRVLDLACGTGEPGLTLARRYGDEVGILGVDAAEGMVNAARAKVEKEGLRGIAFKVMPAEDLALPDGGFDRALCRFGAMLFKDPVKGLSEMHRVLAPGGRFAIAVWGERMSAIEMAAKALEPHLPEDSGPPFAQITSLGAPGALEAALEAAGFTGFEVTQHSLDYRFPNFEAYWDLVEESAMLADLMGQMSPEQQDAVRDEVASLATAYHAPEGLVLPHVYLIASGPR
jgi:ubiquinone/menaquinone biosynthesis C-methylase UbiE